MKNLTFRYSITQFTYWAASSGAAAFATTYLLDKGVSSGTVGLLLATAGLQNLKKRQTVLSKKTNYFNHFFLKKGNSKSWLHNYGQATRHHSAGDFATFSATKILINEIMGRKSMSKLPFEIQYRAQISQRRLSKKSGNNFRAV